MQNDLTLTATEQNEMNWTTGAVQTNGQTYTYSVKHFDEPSCYGIRNGRVSKLEIRLADQVVLNYSRGWDVRAQDAAAADGTCARRTPRPGRSATPS